MDIHGIKHSVDNALQIQSLPMIELLAFVIHPTLFITLTPMLALIAQPIQLLLRIIANVTLDFNLIKDYV